MDSLRLRTRDDIPWAAKQRFAEGSGHGSLWLMVFEPDRRGTCEGIALLWIQCDRDRQEIAIDAERKGSLVGAYGDFSNLNGETAG